MQLDRWMPLGLAAGFGALVSLGVSVGVLVLEKLGRWKLAENVSEHWPLLLVIGGAMYLGTEPESRLAPALLILAGLVLLPFTWGLLPESILSMAG